MTNKYVIKHLNNTIAVFQNNDGDFSVLKRKGEETFPFCPSDFWTWFKDKIEYQSQPLSFVVLTDSAHFTIDNSLTLADENAFLTDGFAINKIREQATGLTILSFPFIENMQATQTIKPTTSKKPIKDEPEQKNVDMSESTIANYFRKQTKGFKS